MAICGAPHPDHPGVTCQSDHDEEKPPQDHFARGVPGWLNEATDKWAAAQALLGRKGAAGRRKLMQEAAQKAKPDDRVGPPVLPDIQPPMVRNDDPPNAHLAAERIEPKRGTRQAEVLHYLRDRLGQWVDGLDLATERVGGAQGLKRVRELRQFGWDIELRPDPNSNTTWQYRLSA